MEPTHVNKTDTEVLLKMLAYQNKLKLLINPKKLDKIPINFQTAFLISNHCELSSEDNTETTLSVLNWNLSAVVKGDSQGCIKQYARSISP
jgi:hypothetical protein